MGDDVADPLEHSRDSVKHAKRRIRELEVEIATYADSRPCERVIEIDPNTSERVGKVKLVKPIPPGLRGTAWDAVSSLRSALDQAGFSLATAAGRRGKNAHFPFGVDLAEVHSRGKVRSKEIPKEVFDAIVACKPYKGGNDLLWGLNKICNTNKHEIIVPLAAASGGFRVSSARISGPLTMGVKWDSTKNELEFARIGEGGELEGNFEFNFFIAIGNIEPLQGQPVIPVLDAIAGEVERVLMAIEAEARRIGLFS